MTSGAITKGVITGPSHGLATADHRAGTELSGPTRTDPR